MITYFQSHYPFVASVLFLIIILLAHIVSIDDYIWTDHTISHLGSQGYDRKWLMQVGFITFGALVVIGILANGLSWRTTPFIIYGIGILLTGIFCAAPFLSDVSYSIEQANLHSLFAQVAGIAFSLGILLQVYFEKNGPLKTVHFVFFLLVIGLSAAFGLLQSNQGIAQRLLYLVSFWWFSFYFRP